MAVNHICKKKYSNFIPSHYLPHVGKCYLELGLFLHLNYYFSMVDTQITTIILHGYLRIRDNIYITAIEGYSICLGLFLMLVINLCLSCYTNNNAALAC